MNTVVFWDFDGTLVYSRHLWSSSVYAALKETEAETAVSFGDVRKHMAYGFTWHTPDRDYRSLTGEKWWEFMNAHIFNSYIGLGVDKDIAACAAEKVRGILKKKENYTVYEDAVETLLRTLCVKNVILSNNYPDLKEVTDKLELTKYFDGMIVSADYGYDKPRRELFDIAKAQYPNAKYYMVGDSVQADILGGKEAGMTTILVHKGFDTAADYCLADLGDIVTIVAENIQ